jgi:hypothetical protein
LGSGNLGSPMLDPLELQEQHICHEYDPRS